MMKPKSAKAKGTRLEKWIDQQFRSIGLRSRRQPGSGIYADFKHDNWAQLPGVGDIIIEAKSWRNGWRTGDKAMGSAELLVIKRDHGDPCVYMPWSTFKAMCEALAEKEQDGTDATIGDPPGQTRGDD